MESFLQSSRVSTSQYNRKTCNCGLPSPMKTSSTPVNYGQKFYGCGKFEETGRRGCKFFEWVDGAYTRTENLVELNQSEEEMVLS